jgi:hypothetical protein
MTPGKYVEWAQRQAKELGVTFKGTPEVIEHMIRNGGSCLDDIFFDYGVQGHKESRPALDAMRAEIESDPGVSHIFIPRRDRLLRPDNPLDGVAIELDFTAVGVTLVYDNKIIKPKRKGERYDIGELLTSLVDYDKSGGDRRELARKVILAQIRLAERGFSTGGRPPYGFRRWLATEAGEPVRELEEGECTRKKGHHVVWRPHEPEMITVRKILKLLRTSPATQVARMLDAEEIPSPDAGRLRTDNGILHQVSGHWNVCTINNIARRPILLAMTAYGQRSMGDQLRVTNDGPRELDVTDYRFDDEPKVIRNPESVQVRGRTAFEPLVDVEEHHELMAELDRRAGSQKGKPRSKEPARNPLGGRIFDMGCGWLMYRSPYLKTFRYRCGLYDQSHGQRCNHNTIDGPAATEFVLSCIRQRLFQPHMWAGLKQRLHQLASKETRQDEVEEQLKRYRQELSQVDRDLESVQQNLARANSSKQFEAISGIFDGLQVKKSHLAEKVQTHELKARKTSNAESEVGKALENLRQLCNFVTDDSNDLNTARRLIEAVNARMFPRFKRVNEGKRTLNRLSGGVVTFGSAEPPIRLYDGPTSREKVKAAVSRTLAENNGTDSPTTETVVSRGEGKSLGNVSRGDRI